jgi:hypothetical protein
MLPITNLRFHRGVLGISQARLGRLSRVSRFKICMYEPGDGGLTEDEQDRIHAALQAEVDRLRNLPSQLEFGQIRSAGPNVELG